MPTTVVLARWFGGWREVSNTAGVAAFGRRSALLSVGAIQAVEEVDRVAGTELSGAFARERRQMTVDHFPQSVAERPYVGYTPGSDCTAPDFAGAATVYPVVAISVSEDDHGELRVAPTIGDIIVGIDELQDHLIVAPSRPNPRTPRPENWALPPGYGT